MTKSIRTKRHHHIRLVKLEAGYREQRAWLSVGMSRIIVDLRLEGWEQLPILVRYAEVQPDGSTVVYEQRFERSQLDEARALFAAAGRPNQWPHNHTTETVQSLNGKES